MKKLIILLFPAYCFGQADSVVVKVPVGQASGMSAVINYLLKADSATVYPTRVYLRTRLDSIITALGAKGTSNFDGTWSSLTGKPSISGTNTGDQDLSGYTPVTRTINTHPLSGNVTVTASDVGLGNVDNTSDAGKPVSTATLTALNLKANLASPTFTGTVSGVTASMVGLGNVTNTSDANKPVSTAQQTALDLKANLSTTPQIVASINATAQAANIGTATLYAVPAAGFYRVSVYITVTQAATTSSTMPSTTIAYTDGNSGTNAHSTTTTATSTGNSVTTTFAQTTYVLYAKASTNITYATGSYASSGATVMQYALRIRVESL